LHALFGEMTFGEVTFGEITFGDLTFGEVAFGDLTFGEVLGNCQFSATPESGPAALVAAFSVMR